MFSLSDHLLAAGAPLTFHYTHPARPVAMQIALAAKLDFTTPSPRQLMRASVFFTSYVGESGATDLLSPAGGAPPQFRAAAVTEVRGQVIADNCDAVAVVAQFDQSGSAPQAGTVPETIMVTTVTFAPAAGRPPLYIHVVKTWPGGRPVSEQEATSAARANAQSFALDVSQASMNISTAIERG